MYISTKNINNRSIFNLKLERGDSGSRIFKYQNLSKIQNENDITRQNSTYTGEDYLTLM